MLLEDAGADRVGLITGGASSNKTM